MNHIKGNIKINEYAKYNKTFKNDVLQELRRCGNVAMYGAGNIATELLQYFETMKISIKKLFVTSSCDNMKLLNVDIEQYTPEEGSKYDIIIIGVSKLYDDEILCYLKNMGYTGKIIRLVV